MNKLLLTLVGSLTLGMTLPALAGPDWQAIEQARKAQSASRSDARAEPHGAAGRSAAGFRCPPRKPALLLDHGPRAQSTPYVNQQRQERYEAALRACKAAGQ